MTARTQPQKRSSRVAPFVLGSVLSACAGSSATGTTSPTSVREEPTRTPRATRPPPAASKPTALKKSAAARESTTTSESTAVNAQTAPNVHTAPTGSSSPSAVETAPVREEAFVGKQTVRYAEFLDELRRVARELEAVPPVRESHARLLADFDLTESDVSLESYSRVRLVFEATRDGGLWGVRWNVTDRMPWSDAIWQSWATRDFSGHVPEITAEAECDELSAFFSFLARDLGIQGFVGLFWPTWNHTVAVWEVRKGASDKSPGVGVRLVVPTSQVWLSREATLGTREFKANRVVFAYQRADLKPDSTLSGPLARHLIAQLRRYGALSNDELLARRNRLGGS